VGGALACVVPDDAATPDAAEAESPPEGAAGDANAGDVDAGEAGDPCPTGFADCDGVASNGCEVNLASDPNHCGNCSRTCVDAPCAVGMCRSPNTIGFPKQGTFSLALPPDVIEAWHLPTVPTTCWLWKIGIIVSVSTSGISGYLGVYSDNGSGSPGKLVAQAPFVTGTSDAGPTGSANEVTLPSPLPMLTGGLPYYVAVVFDANAANTGPVVSVEQGSMTTIFDSNYMFNPLPVNVTLPQMTTGSQVNVYVVVAQ
jgi:hypothetical protein